MIDLSTIPAATLENRGSYATVNGAHKDALREISILCGEFSSLSTRILRAVQPDNDAVPEGVDVLIASARATMSKIEECANRIASLAVQKAQLKPLAWGGK